MLATILMAKRDDIRWAQMRARSPKSAKPKKNKVDHTLFPFFQTFPPFLFFVGGSLRWLTRPPACAHRLPHPGFALIHFHLCLPLPGSKNVMTLATEADGFGAGGTATLT